jgi:hypothetical protein
LFHTIYYYNHDYFKQFSLPASELPYKKNPEMPGYSPTVELRKITRKARKTAWDETEKNTQKIQRKFLVVEPGDISGPAGGNYLLKTTGNGRHFAGRYSRLSPG